MSKGEMQEENKNREHCGKVCMRKKIKGRGEGMWGCWRKARNDHLCAVSSYFEFCVVCGDTREF